MNTSLYTWKLSNNAAKDHHGVFLLENSGNEQIDSFVKNASQSKKKCKRLKVGKKSQIGGIDMEREGDGV